MQNKKRLLDFSNNLFYIKLIIIIDITPGIPKATDIHIDNIFIDNVYPNTPVREFAIIKLNSPVDDENINFLNLFLVII